MFTFVLVLVCFCLVAILFINYVEEKEKISNLNKLINILTIELNKEKNSIINLTSVINTTNSVLRGELGNEINSLHIEEELIRRRLQEINRRKGDLGGGISSLN